MQKWNFIKAQQFILVFLVVDICLQIIYQFPFISIYLPKNGTLVSYIQAIGFSKMLDYDTFIIDYSVILLKAITLFLITIQLLIYRSKNFKEFIINYLVIQRNELLKNSVIYSYVFNNRRIKMMNKNMVHKMYLNKALNELENEMEEWEDKLKKENGKEKEMKELLDNFEKDVKVAKDVKDDKVGVEETTVKEKDNDKEKKKDLVEDKAISEQRDIEENISIDEDKKSLIEKEEEIINEIIDADYLCHNQIIKKDIDNDEDGDLKTSLDKVNKIEKLKTEQEQDINDPNNIKIRIKMKLLDNYLVNFIIYMHRSFSSYSFVDKKYKQDYEEEIIKGEIYIKSKIERKIDDFIDEIDFTKISEEDILFFIENIAEVQTRAELLNSKMMEVEGEEVEEVVIEEGYGKEERVDKDSNVVKEGIITKESKEIKEIVVNTVNQDKETEDLLISLKVKKDDDSKIRSSKQEKLSQIAKPDMQDKQDKPAKQAKLTKQAKLEQIDEKIKKNKDYIYLNSSFFKIYLTKTFAFKYFMTKVFEFFTENFRFIVFFFIVLNHMMNSSLLSLLWPVLVFGYGLIEYPRPGKRFWIIALNYAMFIICVKFLFQLSILENLLWQYLPKDSEGFFFYNPKNGNYKEDYFKFGIKIYSSFDSTGFLGYIIWDTIVLFLIIVQQNLLINRGLWQDIESNIESIKDAYDRIYTSNCKDKIEDKDYRAELIQNRVDALKEEGIKEEKYKEWSKLFNDQFPTIRVIFII